MKLIKLYTEKLEPQSQRCWNWDWMLSISFQKILNVETIKERFNFLSQNIWKRKLTVTNGWWAEPLRTIDELNCRERPASITTKVDYGDETNHHNMSLFHHWIHMVTKWWRNGVRHLSSVTECIGDENVSSLIKKW